MDRRARGVDRCLLAAGPRTACLHDLGQQVFVPLGSRDASPIVTSFAGSSGNSAFDAYRDATLRRLEEEQQNFEAFLDRLRAARDKAEFDQFMEERARKAGSDEDHEDEDREAARNA